MQMSHPSDFFPEYMPAVFTSPKFAARVTTVSRDWLSGQYGGLANKLM